MTAKRFEFQLGIAVVRDVNTKRMTIGKLPCCAVTCLITGKPFDIAFRQNGKLLILELNLKYEQ